MHAARMSHRLLLVPAVALSLMFATVGVADAAANRNAAHACQRGGYLRLVGANGGFASAGQCVSYAAHGGQFVTLRPGEFLLPAGRTATFTSTAINDPPCEGLDFTV